MFDNTEENSGQYRRKWWATQKKSVDNKKKTADGTEENGGQYRRKYTKCTNMWENVLRRTQLATARSKKQRL
jgi:hypothetical protein